MILKITKGKPNREQWLKIHEMIKEGFHTGIDMPLGITWELDTDTEYEPTKLRKQLDRLLDRFPKLYDCGVVTVIIVVLVCFGWIIK